MLSGCLGLCESCAEGVDLGKDAKGKGGVGACRLCCGDQLLPDEGLETEMEPGRVWELCEFCGVEEVAEGIDEMAASLVELDDGRLDGAHGADVWVLGHDGMEYAGNVLFGARELLGEEDGLLCKVGVDGEGPAIDGDLSCAGVSGERRDGQIRTRLELALLGVGGRADGKEVAETGLVEDEVVEEALLGVAARGEGGCEGGPEGGDGLHGQVARTRGRGEKVGT